MRNLLEEFETGCSILGFREHIFTGSVSLRLCVALVYCVLFKFTVICVCACLCVCFL